MDSLLCCNPFSYEFVCIYSHDYNDDYYESIVNDGWTCQTGIIMHDTKRTTCTSTCINK